MAGPASVKGPPSTRGLGYRASSCTWAILSEQSHVLTPPTFTVYPPSFCAFSLPCFVGSLLQGPFKSSVPISSSASSTWAESDPLLPAWQLLCQVTIRLQAGECRLSLLSSPFFLHGWLLWLLETPLASLTLHSPAPLPVPGCLHPVFSAGPRSPALGLNVGPLQGPSLGPFFCFTYTLSLDDPIHFCGSKYHLHDNDFQIYISSTNILRLQTHISCSLTSPLR